MAQWQLPMELAFLITQLAAPLHGQVAWRLQPLMLGILFAKGKRTVASWLRAAGLGHDFRRYYHFLRSLGPKTKALAALLLGLVLARIGGQQRLLFGIDDTPTKRYGPKIEGAGIHHNPTPGPADQKFLYGHIWVTLALLVRHSLWGTIGLPLLALLYVRRRDIPKLAALGVPFRTKLEMAAELVEWLADRLRWLKKPLWIVVDGFYVKRPFLKRALAAGAIVVGRLRRDAALRSLPRSHQQPKRRGPKAKYGAEPISLAKRAGQKRGWQTGVFVLYGQQVVKTYKTFLATYEPAYGLIRVVLVKETDGWVAFMCTDPAATVAQILEAVADRGTIEQDFHDLKEVHGLGQQQVRKYWTNLAVYHLNLWMHTLIEYWAWDQPASELIDRSASPWDDPSRRPSHADRAAALRRECIGREINRSTARHPIAGQLKNLIKSLIKLAA